MLVDILTDSEKIVEFFKDKYGGVVRGNMIVNAQINHIEIAKFDKDVGLIDGYYKIVDIRGNVLKERS